MSLYFIKRSVFTSLIFISLIFSALSARAQTLDEITLKFQWKHQFEFAGFYAAVEKGFYKEAGLEVTLLEHDGKVSAADFVL